MCRLELRTAAGHLLRECDPARKCEGVLALAEAWRSGEELFLDAEAMAPGPAIDSPGRPDRPPLVPPERLARRSVRTREGRIALLHALGHIEFNAVQLALDAVWRFPGLPENYYEDWLGVAADEARHFSWLCERLRAHGAKYGDLPAHDGLWQAALATAGDPLERMALVPRVLEARGLDVSPSLIAAFEAGGDPESAAVLRAILEEEIGHVAIGSRWFRYLCEQRGLDPDAAFAALIPRAARGALRGPLNRAARLAAGFSESELAALAAMVQSEPGASQSSIAAASAGAESLRS
ncbi:MAG: hypothetical protein KatS3mg125_1316 [Lysobacterales bacterium]|jgi:uncharacterized ferritin-like protein (DUF455 family)|nr:MAG: hypothetical protein KatS3mg125_1316 [Xanthomonadales bacterium]